MKYVSALACSLLLTGVGLSQMASVTAEPIESKSDLVAQADAAPEATKARYHSTFESSVPEGYVVEARINPGPPHLMFFSETQPELEQWDVVYIIDGDLYADPLGTTLIATNYDEALAAHIAARQAEIDALLSN